MLRTVNERLKALRNSLSESLDARKIKSALALVHGLEKKEGRFKATERALKNIDLSDDEKEILFNALNLDSSERSKLMRMKSQIPAKR